MSLPVSYEVVEFDGALRWHYLCIRLSFVFFPSTHLREKSSGLFISFFKSYYYYYYYFPRNFISMIISCMRLIDSCRPEF